MRKRESLVILIGGGSTYLILDGAPLIKNVMDCSAYVSDAGERYLTIAREFELREVAKGNI
jgi:hypothetical protein